MIELVLAFQDKDGQYAEHAGVVLASVFHNTSSPLMFIFCMMRL